MKLSMWMIANRIVQLDPELHIRDDAPICLHSARRAYATNCVHVYQEGNSAVCDGEGDKIIIHDMNVNQAFEIIQSVFDFYNEWYSDVQSIVNPEDYQQVIDASWLIFHNPIILLDADNEVLALSSQYAEDDVNSEWRHLCQYGYSSVNYVRFLKKSYNTKDFFIKNKPQFFSFGKELEHSVVLSAAIYHNHLFCGRITILQHDREFNPGDIQLLSFLLPLLAGTMKITLSQATDRTAQNVFLDLIKKNEIDMAKLDQRLLWQLQYMKWGETDFFQLATVHLPEAEYAQDILVLISNLIRKQIPEAMVFIVDQCIAVMYDLLITDRIYIQKKLQGILDNNHLVMGISLPLKILHNLRLYFEQSLYAIEYGNLYHPEQSIHCFYDYALDYMIENSSMEQLLCACHPDIKALYEEDSLHGTDRLQTLSAYLKNNCSLINTAKELFIHRNTLVYRINKITQILHYDINDEYNRDYMKLSLRLVFLYQKKYCNAMNRLMQMPGKPPAEK